MAFVCKRAVRLLPRTILPRLFGCSTTRLVCGLSPIRAASFFGRPSAARCFTTPSEKPTQEAPKESKAAATAAAAAAAAAADVEAKAEPTEAEKHAAELEKLTSKHKSIVEEHAKQIKELKDKLKQSEVNNSALVDRVRGEMTEQDRVRERSKKDIAIAKKFALQKVATGLLELADNFSRAIENADQEQIKESPQYNALYEGLVLTEKLMHKLFEGANMKKMQALGQPLDPNLHMVLFTVEDDSKEPNTIVTVANEGWMLHDRVIRPANVGVSKLSQAKAAEAAAAAQAKPENSEAEADKPK